MAAGFGASTETCASKSSQGATLGMSGYADGYLMLFLWHKMQVQSSLKGLGSGWSMQKDLPPLPWAQTEKSAFRLLLSITHFGEPIGIQLCCGPSQGSEGVGLIQRWPKKSLGRPKEHGRRPAQQRALTAVVSLWHMSRGEQRCLPAAGPPPTALHPNTTEANDALIAFCMPLPWL